MSNPRKHLALIPDMPRDSKMVDQDGNINPVWQLYFEQLSSSLHALLKPEGTVIPKLPTTDINNLTGDQSVANIVYDKTTNEFKGNVLVGVTPTWKTFTLT